MKVYTRFISFALLAVLVGLGVTTSAPHSALAQSAVKPNILFILADDLRASDLRYMPRTQNLLNDRGTEFTKAWVTRSLCCPSRASTLRGQYTHNHRVWVNVPPSGGFWKFHDRGLESSTIATWLDDPDNFADRVDYDTVLTANPPNRWRSAFLVEHRRSPEEYSYVMAVPAYDALRTSRYSYTEYATGERELYRLERDPYERKNVYKNASSRLISTLHARLAALKRCSGTGQTRTSCEEAEGG